jgi:DNA-binding NarL/FixJ family response regulator/anti-sigma regulatory factor (Ser/Thr protein kinase)
MSVVMNEPIHILILEDNGADAELVKRELRKASLNFTVQWAQDKGAFVAALETSSPNLILADYSLPGFDGLTALTLARRRWADVPVVIVSGAIGEEVAVETLKAGATDYVLKQRLSRLGPVVHRALSEARERAEKRNAEEALRQSEEALREANATLESKVAQRTAELEYRAGQLQKLTLELSEAEDRERKRLAEILHDDLQQILAAAKFHLSLVRNRVKYDPSLQATAAEIDHMLKDAIDKSRSLSHELSPAVLHHGDFTETLAWLAGQVQAKHGLLVCVDTFSKVELQSDALKAFLYKAAQELLFNVVKHGRTNEARIRVRRSGRCICLSVSDRGRGFDPQELGETAGFGLFSIRERIELLGGRMTIRSAKGKGSIFHIVVPDGDLRKKDVTAKKEPDGRVTEGWRSQGRGERPLRVLLADDHEIVREGLMSLLSEERSIQVVGEAANGREAVDLADQLEPDVVIMDVSMPLIDGDEATRQIKKHRPNTRIIALSMHDEPESIKRMRAAGADAYVLKTAPSEELLAAIHGTTSDS